MNLTTILDIRYPVILAPMFLVTNKYMVEAAIDAGATGTLVAMNYRDPEDLRIDIRYLKEREKTPFGVNLILSSSFTLFRRYFDICLEENVAFVITSLGDPVDVVKVCHNAGIKVFSDVVNLKHAAKAVSRNVDALIAVNKNAGGHAGLYSAEELIPSLKSKFDVPVISAGGVGNNHEYKRIINLGADGVSIGTPFIASKESEVSEDYKKAIVHNKKEAVRLTSRISGVPVTVIRTPYTESIRKKPTVTERFLSKNRKLRRFVRGALSFLHLGRLELYITGPDYKHVYCAGPSLQDVDEILPVKKIIHRIVGNTTGP